MFKITDILSLGTEYSITDPTGKVVKTIQIVPATDILDAALGEFTVKEFKDVSNYLKESISVLTGYEHIDQHKVLWYATSESEVVVSELVEYAIQHGYNKIILEHLEEVED